MPAFVKNLEGAFAEKMSLVDIEVNGFALKGKNAVKAEVRELSEPIALVRRHLIVFQN